VLRLSGLRLVPAFVIHLRQPELLVVNAIIMRLAAGEAGHPGPEGAHPLDIGIAG
jgi:hypothetical protein